MTPTPSSDNPRAARRQSARRQRAAGLPVELAVAAQPQSLAASIFAFGVIPIFLFVVLVFLTITAVSDTDIWFHLALGRELVEFGRFPHTDIFSFTAAGNEWISSGWLASALYYFFFTLGSGMDSFFGPSGGGLVLIVLAVVAAGFAAVYFVSLRRGAPHGTMALLLLAAALASYMRFNPRPDVFTPSFMAIVLLLLATAPTAGAAWRLWALPFIFAAWPNFHAGFFIGFVPVGFYLLMGLVQWFRAGTPQPALTLGGRFLPLLLCFVAWMANPYGYRILALAGKIARIPEVTNSIWEWMPLIVATPGYSLPAPVYVGLIALVLLAAAALLAGRRGLRLPLWSWATLVVLAGLMFYQRRHVALFAIAVPAVLVCHLAPLDAWLARHRGLIPASAALGALLICTLKMTGALQWGGASPPEIGRNCQVLPCATTEFLTAAPPPENMFNSYGLGGHLLYHLAGRTKVFIDGRLDVYDHSTWRDLLDAQEKPERLDEIIARYNLATFVVDIRNWFNTPNHLAPRLAARPDMKLVYFDDGEAVFVRETTGTANYIASHRIEFLNPFRPAQLDAAAQNPSDRQALQIELEGMIQQSMGSASSLALGARAARLSRDSLNAHRLLMQALERDTQNPVALAEALAQGVATTQP